MAGFPFVHLNMSLALTGETLDQLRTIVWGKNPREDVFQRWTQGIVLSQFEPSALIQFEGGPCAILAPVQAFLLRNLLKQWKSQEWKTINSQECKQLLVNSLCQILEQASAGSFYIVTGEFQVSERRVNSSIPSCSSDDPPLPDVEEPETKESETLEERPTPKKVKLDQDHFHSNLQYSMCNKTEQVLKTLAILIDQWQQTESCGLLLFLYSVLLTKGLERIKSDMSDPDEPLIDGTHGHGSQSLINLMITGSSTSHVWDGDQDLGGLKLRGVQRQSEIGFLTLLEHLRYCQVGTHLKNPRNPIWVLASETHLTVLFSELKQLVSEETQSEKARRVFKSFDPEGNGFISTVLLEDALRSLDLVSEPEYVKVMAQRLDPEGLGIVLLYAFMEEFYPKETSSVPDVFTVWHYNGLSRSNAEAKVEYRRGEAVLLESDVRCLSDSNAMLTCLQTKWPSIDVRWPAGVPPSIN